MDNLSLLTSVPGLLATGLACVIEFFSANNWPSFLFERWKAKWSWEERCRSLQSALLAFNRRGSANSQANGNVWKPAACHCGRSWLRCQLFSGQLRSMESMDPAWASTIWINCGHRRWGLCGFLKRGSMAFFDLHCQPLQLLIRAGGVCSTVLALLFGCCEKNPGCWMNGKVSCGILTVLFLVAPFRNFWWV